MVSTKLEESVNGVMETFHNYSRKNKEWDELNMQELKELLKKEYPIFLLTCGSGNPDALIEDLFNKNKNQDQQVSFNDFMKIIGKIASLYHKLSHNDDTCSDEK